METKLRFKKRYKKHFLVLIMMIMSGILADKVQAYVMPAEQLLYLMGTNFSRFKTLVITQSTYFKNSYDNKTEVALNEKIWLKTPGLYHSELVGASGELDTEGSAIAVREPGGHMAFRPLLMASNLEKSIAFLSDMGVDIESVAFTRFEGTVAYQLGDSGPESPKLVIDKDTFLPVSFCYKSQTDWEHMLVTIRFGDYQKLGKGWYPYDITYSSGEKVLERYVMLNLQVNTPIEYPLSKIILEPAISPKGLEAPQKTPEDNRLREIIEFLKDKYR